MPKPNKRKSYNPNDRFIAFPYSMLNSESFKDLSPKATRLLIEFKKRFNGSNNGEITLSTREAGEITKSGKCTGGKIIQELIEHGFIEKTYEGMFTYKKASKFLLTFERDSKNNTSNKWKEWNK